VLEDLVGELITGSDRLALEKGLLALIQDAEVQAGAKRARLAERQVFAVGARLARFVDYLGYDELPPEERPPSLADRKRPIFSAPAPIPPGVLPVLKPQPVNYSATYIVDWFEAFKHLAVDNAGHAAGRDISPEQNARLGEILGRIAGEGAAASV
jgi:hypothetical protein